MGQNPWSNKIETKNIIKQKIICQSLHIKQIYPKNEQTHIDFLSPILLFRQHISNCQLSTAMKFSIQTKKTNLCMIKWLLEDKNQLNYKLQTSLYLIRQSYNRDPRYSATSGCFTCKRKMTTKEMSENNMNTFSLSYFKKQVQKWLKKIVILKHYHCNIDRITFKVSMEICFYTTTLS